MASQTPNRAGGGFFGLSMVACNGSASYVEWVFSILFRMRVVANWVMEGLANDEEESRLQNNIVFSILFYKESLVEFSLPVKNVLGATKWVLPRSDGRIVGAIFSFICSQKLLKCQ